MSNRLLIDGRPLAQIDQDVADKLRSLATLSTCSVVRSVNFLQEPATRVQNRTGEHLIDGLLVTTQRFTAVVEISFDVETFQRMKR